MNLDNGLPLVLGTVQIGLPYGIANVTGQPDQETATAIVRAAWEGGICEFDTAQAYGTSESVLGEAFRRLDIAGQVRVISKLDPALDVLDARAVERAVEASLERLGVARLDGLMLHRESQFDLWNQGLGRLLTRQMASGKVRRIGVSVYSPLRAAEALATDGVEMIQAPTSIVDRRFVEAGVYRLAAQQGKSVYVRSVFLKGLILMEPERIPESMGAARPMVERLTALARELGLSRQELALGAVKALGASARVVVGAETPEQVRDNVKAWERPGEAGLWDRAAAVGRVEEWLLDPSRWPK